jgi:hypothetical protein
MSQLGSIKEIFRILSYALSWEVIIFRGPASLRLVSTFARW